MQNKPNFQNGKMNVRPVKTMNYEQLTMNYANKNKPNSNPTCRGVASGEAGSNPTCSELACTELGRSVEPLIHRARPKFFNAKIV